MESAEHEVLRSLGLAVMQPIPGGGHLTWPRVSCHCDYLAAARFEDLLKINVSVQRLGKTSVTYEFDFHRGDVAIARGTITAVCCVWMPGEPLRKVEISPELRETLAALMPTTSKTIDH
jgi:acyl-CoA thioester hydrolase